MDVYTEGHSQFLKQKFNFTLINHSTETEQDPVGPSWIQKPFHVPLLLFVEKDFSLQDLPRVPKDSLRTVSDQGQERLWRQGRGSQETRVQQQGGAPSRSLLRNILNNI